jgi:malate/lactate dehydrogenase
MLRYAPTICPSRQLSLPRRVGRSGVLNEFEIEANKEEQIGLERSVEALQLAMERLDHRLEAI